MKTLLNILLACGIAFMPHCIQAQESHRWSLGNENQISWQPEKTESHQDHIEMSGKSVSVVLRYGVQNGAFTLNKSMVWPMLRTIPNNTHASLMRRYGWNVLDMITVNGRAFTDEQVERISLKGILKVESKYDLGRRGQWKLIREYFPSTEHPALMECYSLINTGKTSLAIELPQIDQQSFTDPQKGVTGSFRIETRIDKSGHFTLQPNDTLHFSASISAYPSDKESIQLNGSEEKKKIFPSTSGALKYALP